MSLLTLLDFTSLFFIGILSGMEFVIHYGLRGPSETLDETAQLQLRQALVLRLRVLVPAFFLPATILSIAATLLNSGTPGSLYRWLGILALLSWIVIRIIGTVPINSATLDWQISAPPSDWKTQVAHAERFHIVGVWSTILAFALFLVAIALKLSIH